MGTTAEGQDGGNPTNVYPGTLGNAAVPKIGDPAQGNLASVCDDDGPLPTGPTTPGFEPMPISEPIIGG